MQGVTVDLQEESIEIVVIKKLTNRLPSTAATKWNIAAIRIQFSVIRKWFVQRPIANLDAARSFVFVLKSHFCKWRALIGLHLCQAFLQKDKIFSCSHVGVVFLFFHSSPAKSVNEYCVFVEVMKCQLSFQVFLKESCAAPSKGTLRSEDMTAAKMSLQKWICVLLVFIAIIPAHLLCQM